MDSKYVKRTLLLAADIIREGGWTYGEARNSDGQHCTLGAVADASEEVAQDGIDVDQLRMNAHDAIYEEFSARHMPASASIVVWNDVHCTGGEQAAEILESAAARC